MLVLVFRIPCPQQSTCWAEPYEKVSYGLSVRENFNKTTPRVHAKSLEPCQIPVFIGINCLTPSIPFHEGEESCLIVAQPCLFWIVNADAELEDEATACRDENCLMPCVAPDVAHSAFILQGISGARQIQQEHQQADHNGKAWLTLLVFYVYLLVLIYLQNRHFNKQWMDHAWTTT